MSPLLRLKVSSPPPGPEPPAGVCVSVCVCVFGGQKPVSPSEIPPRFHGHEQHLLLIHACRRPEAVCFLKLLEDRRRRISGGKKGPNRAGAV